MSRLRMAVIGVGHLGKSHAGILARLPDVELVGVVDVNADQARQVAEACGTKAYSDYRLLIGQIDAATVVVPTVHHHAVAKVLLERSIPVLVEKPIATTVEQADDLIRAANAGGVPLQVGHIERFNPAFEELVHRPIQPKFVESERHGQFTGRSTDIGVVLDLMIHDLDLLLSLIGGPVVRIEALGTAVFGGHEDVVNARLEFANGCVAHITASRVSQHAKRRLRVWAPEGYAGIDFVQKKLLLVQPSRTLQRHGLRVAHLDAAGKQVLKNEIFGKHLETLELECRNPDDQLTCELKHFIECVRTGRRPRVSGEDGREALALAERILAAIAEHRWNGSGDPAKGLAGFPPPIGTLFEPGEPGEPRAAA